MKKTMGILLLAVFALSFVAGIAVTKAEAASKCIATCDLAVGYYYVCCPVGNSQWRCYYDYTKPCGTIGD